MSKASRSVQYGTPDAAPLLKIQGAGPRINVSGYRKPEYGTPAKTVRPPPAQTQKTGKAGVGRQVDITG